MRAVRCEACGAKALLAAAKCPKCGHLFDVRDGFGELVPLAYCSSCDSYYPESLGSCRWCGTKPERAPIGPYVWKAAGAVALAAMVVSAWVLRDSGTKTTADSGVQSALRADTSVQMLDTAAPRVGTVPSDIAIPSAQAPSPETDQTSPAGRTTVSSAGSIARDSVNRERSVTQAAPEPEHSASPSPASAEPARSAARPSPDPAPTASAPSRPKAKSVAKSMAKLSTPSSKSRRSNARWVSSVSKHWVLVRADASRSSRVVASIGPNTRVQLGETRGEWRRIRARGLSGWVEHAAFFALLGTSGRPHGLATR